ncbi:MAG: putative zinc-binding metallopeptidase [Acidisphaera sp.]|nr:putative zinc-binding metallopeptidase [Acidisphaera sp.]MBV9811298.1 putative zinc-binding metallopeptidase [Acetobacteraceae bacterium]
MRLFTCPNCSQMLDFENTVCEQCGHHVGYCPPAVAMLDAAHGSDLFGSGEDTWTLCANARHDACNWLVRSGDAGAYCRACAHNRTIPDISVPENLTRWQRLESAKRRLFYGLMRLRLPLPTRGDDPQHGLAFDFLAELAAGPQVMTGHDDGLITIALKEADDAERERMRAQMGELYRTPLGHFRHEVGHFYWDVLVRDGGELEEFRALFGDERRDYGQALREYYARAGHALMQNGFVSPYASSHPWEDFAETWAHYLHIIDALEMAAECGLRAAPDAKHGPSLSADLRFDPYRADSAQQLLDRWLPLTFAVNNLNRAVGQPDLYPFVISREVVQKLEFVRRLVRAKTDTG